MNGVRTITVSSTGTLRNKLCYKLNIHWRRENRRRLVRSLSGGTKKHSFSRVLDEFSLQLSSIWLT